MTPADAQEKFSDNPRTPMEILQHIMKSDGEGLYILTDFYRSSCLATQVLQLVAGLKLGLYPPISRFRMADSNPAGLAA